MAEYLKFNRVKCKKTELENYSKAVLKATGDSITYYRFTISLPKKMSENGRGYIKFPSYELHPSNYDKVVDYIKYNNPDDFFHSKLKVSVATGVKSDGTYVWKQIELTPHEINKCAAGNASPFSSVRYAEIMKSINREQLNEETVIPKQAAQTIITANVDLMADKRRTPHERSKLAIQTGTKFTVTDRSTKANQEKKIQRLTDIHTKFGTEEAVTPSHGPVEYANLDEMRASIKKIAANNVKEFEKVTEAYSKLVDWAQENNVALSITAAPIAPAVSAVDVVTMQAYADEIKKWRKEFSDEITSLKEQGYDVPKSLYKPQSSRVPRNHYVEMAEFNSARNTTPYNENGLLVNSSPNGTYMASVLGKYGLSKNETKMLEAGESVVFTDVPMSNTEVKTFVGVLKPITKSRKAWYKSTGVDFDGHTPSEFTHDIELEEINKTDPRFADVEHNERYRMNKEFYDMDLSRTAIERKTKTNTAPTRRVNIPETKAASLPTMRLRGNTITHGKFDENSIERRLRSYHTLRTQPATEIGKKLGFETAWDEKRFFDSFTALQMLSGGSGIRSNKQKVKLLERAVNNNFDGIAVDTASTKILDSFDKPWKEMMEQAKLRQTEPSPAGAAKGLVSAWEEKIVEDYEKLTNSSYDRDKTTPEVRRIFARYYRLEETLDIRKTGQLISEQDVGTDKDKYAQLSVSGFYKYASDNGIAKGYKNRREERIAESLPVDHYEDDLDDIPDFT